MLTAAAAVIPAAVALAAPPGAEVPGANPEAVAWLPWGEAAFAEAKQAQKPVFLSIDTATSELSRAMHRQSFANPETAAFLNENFICIHVDAKVRPDVFALYQNYLQVTKQVSGPPLNIWLTPELKPFEGANYLPPTEEWGKEGFITAVTRIAAAWKNDPDVQRRKADEAVAAVAAAREVAAPATITGPEIAALLATATEAIRSQFDAAHGGFGEPPRFAEPERLRFLLRDAATRDIALATLRTIIDAPFHDPLDGGFFRYAVDTQWHQPYFQKHFADQPRLALALLEAARVTGDARFSEAARSALTCALDSFKAPDGDYANALDASGDDLAGYHFWTLAGLREVLGESTAREFSLAYGVTATGNLIEDAYPGVSTKGENLLFRAQPRGEPDAELRLAAARATLLQHRRHRPAPRRDEGATSGSHGLMLAALSQAAAQLPDPTFLAAAKAEAAFIRHRLLADSGGLRRLAGQDVPASPLDYAQVVDGLLAFAAAADDKAAESLAVVLVDSLNTRFRDPQSRRYFVIAPDAGPAFWSRVQAPATANGEIGSVEAALLTALTAHPLKAVPIEPLIQVVAAEVKSSVDAPRGELLLALKPAR